MNNLTKAAGVLMALGFAGAASAQMSATNAYLGAGLSFTNIAQNSTDIAGNTSHDDRDNGGKIFGGYHFNQWLSGELAYTKLGTATATFVGANSSGEANAWSLSAVGTWPINNAWSVFGRIGGSRNHLKTNATAVSATHTRNEVIWGFGANWDFQRNLGLRVEWEDYGRFGNDPTANPGATGRAKVDAITASLVYKF